MHNMIRIMSPVISNRKLPQDALMNQIVGDNAEFRKKNVIAGRIIFSELSVVAIIAN